MMTYSLSLAVYFPPARALSCVIIRVPNQKINIAVTLLFNPQILLKFLPTVPFSLSLLSGLESNSVLLCILVVTSLQFSAIQKTVLTQFLSVSLSSMTLAVLKSVHLSFSIGVCLDSGHEFLVEVPPKGCCALLSASLQETPKVNQSPLLVRLTKIPQLS